MRSEIVAVYRTLHTWTGILSGMFLFIAFYAGALTLFKDQLEGWATPPVAAEHRVVPLERANDLIRRTLEERPDASRAFWLHLDAEHGTGALEWEVRPKDAGEHDEFSARTYTATLDGDRLDVEEHASSKVGDLVNLLHMVVGLPIDNDLTRAFMGIIAMLYFLSLVSGVVYLLPRLTRDLFALRIDDQLRRMWRDAHVVVGLASLPFHLLIALTATAFAFHDPIYGVQGVLVHEGELGAVFRGPPPADPTPPDLNTLLPPEEIVARVHQVAPDLAIYGLQYAGVTTPAAGVRVWGHDPQGFEFRTLGGFALVDPYTGEIRTTSYLPGHQGAGGTVLSGLFASHFATFGGGLITALYFVLALAGAWLFYSGNLLWLEVRRKRARRGVETLPDQTPSTRFLASATVGVTLGSVSGIAVTLASAKWLYAAGLDPDAWIHIVYYGVFFLAVGWAFVRGGAVASIDLLRLAVLTALAVPLTSLAAWFVPGLWAHTEPALLAVDGMAVLFALGFLLMERATTRRAYHGPRDSVWSAVPVASDQRQVTSAS